MKRLLLFTLMIITAATSWSQTIFRTARGGDYTDGNTWQGGAAGAPGTTMNTPACNCKIVVGVGHSLRVNQNVSLTNAAIILDGDNSNLTFGPNNTITLSGNATIDLQSTSATITRANANNRITINGTEIYNGNFEFQSSTNGTVQGLASASSVRASPAFQNGTLPVKLSEFSASGKGSGVALAWKTDLEVNSSHFEVERSGDGKDWASIGSVQAAGTVSVEQSYSFTDPAPLDGDNFYRLRIVDIDGRYEFSPIKSVSVTTTALNVVAGPNPATSFLHISVNQPGREPYRLRLINRAGQVVFDQKYAAANNRIQLSVSNYADGSYFLEVTNNNGLRKISKVMIVRN